AGQTDRVSVNYVAMAGIPFLILERRNGSSLWQHYSGDTARSCMAGVEDVLPKYSTHEEVS
ncbi:MAG: hypothetical protein AAGI03_17770, partial [Pseudomonadota bacterium]